MLLFENWGKMWMSGKKNKKFSKFFVSKLVVPRGTGLKIVRIKMF